MLQDAWASTLQSGGSLSRGDLLRAMRSRWIDGWRRERAVVELVSPDALESPSEVHARFEAAQALAPAWASLREEEREALHLCVVEGYTAAEAAEILDCPRNTVLSLCHRGRAKLRAALTDEREVMP